MGMAMFSHAEHDQLGLDERWAMHEVEERTKDAAVLIRGLVRARPLTASLVAEVESAAAAALQDPTAVGHPYWDPEEELFVHEETLRGLAGRIGRTLGLDTTDFSAHPRLSRDQGRLAEICQNIGETIRHLHDKKVAAKPTAEPRVKHILFATTRASFKDAVPDGRITFTTPLGGHLPDFGVPSLRTCVELKVARDTDSLKAVVGGIVEDMSTYGSEDYDNFIAVIYTQPGSGLTQELMEAEFEARLANLDAETRYDWTYVLAEGPLSTKAEAAAEANASSQSPVNADHSVS